MAGSGQDIWYASDQFHYAYQALSGDGQIVARVTTVQNTNVWAKVGVMIRESTDPGSPYAFMLVTPGSGVASQHRLAPAINATGPTVSGIAAPVWLEVARSGDDLHGVLVERRSGLVAWSTP